MGSGTVLAFELCGESPVGGLTGIPHLGTSATSGTISRYPIRQVVSGPKPEMMSGILELIVRKKIT